MSEKLLPCPFCGTTELTLTIDMHGWKIVQCDDCGMRGPCIDLEGDQYLDRWNVRADAPAMRMCPTCGRSDDEYIKSQLPCADRWHAEDHPRHREAARSAASTVEPVAFANLSSANFSELLTDLAELEIDETSMEALQEADRRIKELEAKLSPTTSPNSVVADHATTEAPEPDAVREALDAVFRDHYWDSFEADKALILQHVKDVLDYSFRYMPALSRPAHGGWLDISTAPKDGTDILVCDETKSDGFRQVVFWDEDRTDEWRWSTSDGPTFHQNAFTHWQRLPAPPIARNDRQSGEPR